MRIRDVVRFFISVASILLAVHAPSEAQDPATGVGNVLTWQNDNGRTGQNLNEGVLVYNSLSKSSFGQRCSFQLDGQVYAQPLIVTNSKINGTKYNVAYVVTQNDTLYAINATPPSGTGGTCGPVASLPFLTTGVTSGHSPVDCKQIGDKGCGTVGPKVGILGTPVIVPGANHTATMWLVTETQTGTPPNLVFYHYLHSVDLPTLTENGTAVPIFPPGQQSSASAFSQSHIQRPGLLYANGYVYVAFSMMDGSGTPYPNGAVFRYNATTLAASGYFQTSLGGVSGSDGGGIWQGGAGLALGPNKSGVNNIYFNTANGVFDADTGGTNYGDSFVELDPTTMTVATNTSGAQLTFTPADQFLRSDYNKCSSTADTDFGSGGVMLIPPHELNSPYVAVSGDKEGGIWFMDMDNPAGTGHVTSCDGNCTCTVTNHGNLQSFPILGSTATISPSGPVIHTNPAFWETGTGTNYLYISSQHCCGFTPSGRLLQYTLCPTGQKPINSNCSTNSVSAKDSAQSPVVFQYGVTPTITQSASDSTNAIVWALRADGSAYGSSSVGILYAFKAVDMSYLYSSAACSGDALLYPATKFSIPTVAGGFVYVAGQGPFNATQNNWNSGMFYIFGGLTRTC